MGTMVYNATTDAHDRTGKLERSHHYMRKVYENVCQNLPAFLKDQRLPMTFKASKDTFDSDVEKHATTLVYGVQPKLARRSL